MKTKPLISWSDFEKIQICTGVILSAEIFAEARKPAYKLSIDFGPYGIKKSSAQITEHYSAQELVGKQIVAVINFPPKQIANMMSECLVIGAVQTSGSVVLLSPDEPVALGLLIA